MRFSHGSFARRESGGVLSDPPYLVAVTSTVRRYPSYSRGQFLPHCDGSVVSSFTSTKRRYGFFSSCLWLKMFVSSSAMPKVASALTIAVTMNNFRDRPYGAGAGAGDD